MPESPRAAQEDRLVDEIAPLMALTRNDPELFFRLACNAPPLRKWQHEVCARIKKQLEEGRTHIRVLARTCHGAGKALTLNTPLPTPTGWTTMGAVRAGDELLNEEGRPVVVLAISPIEIRESFRLHFDDGATIETSDEHVWSALSLRARGASRMRGEQTCDWRDRWDLAKPVTTATIRDSILTTSRQLAWCVPNTKQLRGQSRPFPIPPYTLGFWLGDGTTITPALTIGHEDAGEVLASLRAEEIAVHEVFSQRKKGASLYRLEKQTVIFRAAGLLGRKHIPAVLLRADAPTRLALLQGLMDSDGYGTRRGGMCSITLSDERLFRGVLELIRTFGWAPRVVTRRPKGQRENWTASFRPDARVFRLARKAALLPPPGAQASRHTARTIRAVEPLGKMAVKCLVVDSPRHLYLAGEAMVPTHNTFLAAGLTEWVTMTRRETRGLTTAPTWQGVENLLWPEIRRLHRDSVFGQAGIGRCLTTQLLLDPEWFTIGLSTDRPPNLEGHHSRTCALRVVDEAKAVPGAIFDATEGLLDAPETFDIWISTPNVAYGNFYDRDITEAREDDGVIRVVVTIDDLVAEGIPGKNEWRAYRLQKWGLESDEYQSRCLACYLTNSERNLFPPTWVEKAMAMEPRTMEVSGVFGALDVAGSVDGDENAVMRGRGFDHEGFLQSEAIDAWKEPNTTRTRDRALRFLNEDTTERRPLAIDTVGIGKGLYDGLAEKRYEVLSFVAQAKPNDPTRYYNRKAELAFFTRDLLESGHLILPSKRNPIAARLLTQMAGMRFKVTPKGQKQLIDPEDSPDLVDALLIFVHAALAGLGRGIIAGVGAVKPQTVRAREGIRRGRPRAA